ncbi:hypothetical protein DRP04_09180 [Archaeoglobales archaeon]|nr:MAG: hypothetical protein DRP04_09180 [Archaeoglobales archaeon]
MVNVTLIEFNVSVLNESVFNISSYPAILNFTNLTRPEAFFSPIKEVWLNTMGDWFYAFIVFLTCGVVYIKSRSIFPTALLLLFLSAAMIVAMPYEVGIIMYLALVLALFAVLWALLVKER